MSRTTDTTSVSDHRSRLKDHLRQVNETGRPLFITTNGETEAVVLSPAAYEKLMNEADLARSLSMLDRSMEDIEAGRVRPGREAVEGIAEELGLPLKRRTA